MRQWKAMVLLVIILIIATAGCDRVRETMTQLRETLHQDVAWNPQQENQLEIPDPDDITLEETYEPVQTMGQPSQEMTVSLYFANEDRTGLVRTEKQIPKVEGMARATLETLLEGPTPGSNLLAAVPVGTQLLDIHVKPEEGLCIADFSHELRNQLTEGQQSELLAVYAIANTLCQFDTIQQVEFRVEGQNIATLAGETDLSQAVTANGQLVQTQ